MIWFQLASLWWNCSYSILTIQLGLQWNGLRRTRSWQDHQIVIYTSDHLVCEKSYFWDLHCSLQIARSCCNYLCSQILLEDKKITKKKRGRKGWILRTQCLSGPKWYVLPAGKLGLKQIKWGILWRRTDLQVWKTRLADLNMICNALVVRVVPLW